MQLNAALTEIAAFLGLDADALIAYAAEDTIGGYHFDPMQATFPGGSLWGVEGQVLYALVRALRPEVMLEMGTWHGASATHILAAQIHHPVGWVHSVDVWEGAGTLVPERLRPRWTRHFKEAVAFLGDNKRNDTFNFVFEDCIHSESEVYAIVTALKPKLRKGAVVVHHDSEHGDDGQQIQRALTRAGVNWRSWLIEPSDCGLAIWRAE